jgi:hypothetical protein
LSRVIAVDLLRFRIDCSAVISARRIPDSLSGSAEGLVSEDFARDENQQEAARDFGAATRRRTGDTPDV